MRNSIAVFSLFVLLIQTSQAQSPWTRDKGKAYVQLGYSGLFYNQIQFKGNKVLLPADVSDVTLQAYGEYGLTSKLEVQLIVPFKLVSYEYTIGSNSESLSGIGNVAIGLKYKIYDKKLKISSGFLYTSNSIKKDNDILLSSGFNANTFLPYVSVGSSSGKFYYFAKVGYGYMDNDYSDFLNATFEVGCEVIKQGHLMFVLDTRNIVLKEDAFINDEFQSQSYLDRQTYNAVGIKGNYEFTKDKFGANASVLGAMGIDNAPLAPSINFGVYAKL